MEIERVELLALREFFVVLAVHLEFQHELLQLELGLDLCQLIVVYVLFVGLPLRRGFGALWWFGRPESRRLVIKRHFVMVFVAI